MTAQERNRLMTIAALVVLAAAALFLRFYRISDPIGGFHAFNEGFYYEQALADLARGPFAWLYDPLDFNNPPLYTLLLTTVFRILEPSVTLARTVAVCAGIATVGVTYALGRAVYNTRVAVIAAAFVAVTPGFILVSRNNQVDALLVALQTASVLGYVLAVTRKDVRYAWLGGGLLGLALLTKLPAVLIIASLVLWETWRTRSLRWVARPRVRAYLVGSLLVGAPWYLVQAIRHTTGYFAAQAGVGGQASLMNLEALRMVLLSEWVWLFSPLGALAGIIGFWLLARDRHFGDTLILALAGVQLLFYLFFHFHTYYLVAFVPFVALAAGRTGDALLNRTTRPGMAAVTVTLAGMLVFSAMLLGSAKFGKWGPEDTREALGPDASDVNLYVEYGARANYHPALDLAFEDVGRVTILPQGTIAPADWTPEEGKRELLLIVTGPFTGLATGEEPPFYDRFEVADIGVSLLGLRATQVQRNVHAFSPERVDLEWGSGPLIGFTSTLRPSDKLVYDLRVLAAIAGIEP